jgi:hypothetical protein
MAKPEALPYHTQLKQKPYLMRSTTTRNGLYRLGDEAIRVTPEARGKRKVETQNEKS